MPCSPGRYLKHQLVKGPWDEVEYRVRDRVWGRVWGRIEDSLLNAI